jgi:hypothetical protein
MRFESHLGTGFRRSEALWASDCVQTAKMCVQRRSIFPMASIRKRTKKDGTTSFMVCWRDPASSKEQGITFANEAEAVTLKRLLDANKQSFEIAQ